MEELRFNKTQRALIYVIDKLKESLEGRKKLMKLMFLIEHYDINRSILTKVPMLNNDFIIYHYGVFSFDVMNDYISLYNRKIIKEYPIKSEIDVSIDNNLRTKIDLIISKFGQKHGFQLEEETLEMMGLTKETKIDFFGKSVKELIKN